MPTGRVDATPPGPTPSTRRPRTGLIALLIAAGALIMVLGGGVVYLFMRTESPVETAIKDRVNEAANTKLRLAYEACGQVGDLEDNDQTLYLDMKGEDLASGDLTIVDIYCILEETEAPSYVTRSMEQTRALDGRQSETWDSFEASWTYHPDDGLDILIREK